MWMHLANRAFLSGASAQKGLLDTEDQGIVVLPSSWRDDIDDGNDDATETVHLINPSMNELMRAITTANQRPILITQPGSQTNLQRGGRIDDELMYEGVEEEPQPDTLTFVSMLGGGPNYYPHFVREICSNVVDQPDYMRRALFFDDLHFVRGGGDNEDIDNSTANDVHDVDGGSFLIDNDLSSSHETWRPGYWITLAHILAVVACHRWGL